MSAGQKACNIFEVKTLGKTEVLIPSIKGGRCWRIYRIPEILLHVKNLKYGSRSGTQIGYL